MTGGVSLRSGVEQIRCPLAPLHTSKAQIVSSLEDFPILSFIRPAARQGWYPDLWENFMGSETNPLRFEHSDQVRAYAADYTPGLDEVTIEDLLRHWQSAITLDWMEKIKQ